MIGCVFGMTSSGIIFAELSVSSIPIATEKMAGAMPTLDKNFLFCGGSIRKTVLCVNGIMATWNNGHKIWGVIPVIMKGMNKDSCPLVRRTAVPVFMGRVSPVLDTCTQLVVVESGGKDTIVRRTIPMKGGSLFKRARELHKLGIGVIICGAVSDVFFNLLHESDIELVRGIVGDVDDVIEAYCNGALGQPRFRMPGSD